MAPGKLDFSGRMFSFYKSKEKEACSEKQSLSACPDGAGAPVKGSSYRRDLHTPVRVGWPLGLGSKIGAHGGQGEGSGERELRGAPCQHAWTRGTDR